MLKQLIYVSGAVVDFDDAALEALLFHARDSNGRAGITGVLLYDDGSFLQVLEGESIDVQALYDRITRDARHRDAEVLIDRRVAEREFGDWSMGYLGGDDARELPGFVDLMEACRHLPARGSLAQRMLDAFQQGRWRRKVS